MTTSSTTGQTDFTGIVNAVQMLTQMVGQNNKTINAIAELFPELPMPSPGNALDMIRINSGGTAYEARTISQVASDLGLLQPSVGNALDMIRVNSGGTAYEARTPTQVVSDLGLNNTVPVGASNQATSTTISVTTPSFTAPSAGALVIFGDGTSSGTLTSASLTASLAGLVTLFSTFGASAFGASAFGCGYLPMVAANSSTVTFSMTASSSVVQTITVMAFFLPQA